MEGADDFGMMQAHRWWLSGKESACNAGDMGLILGWEYPLEEETATHSRFLPGKFHGERSLVTP